MKTLIMFALVALSAFADYIPDHQRYTLQDESYVGYMGLVEEAHREGLYGFEELKSALAKKTDSQLSVLLRVMAHDELGDSQMVSEYAKSVEPSVENLLRYPPFILNAADALLRVGEFEKVKLLLDSNEIVMLLDKYKWKAYYYRAIASYLQNGEIGKDFKIAKNHFKIARDIYYSKDIYAQAH